MRARKVNHTHAEAIAQAAPDNSIMVRIEGLEHVHSDMYRINGVSIKPLYMPVTPMAQAMTDAGWTQQEAEQAIEDWINSLMRKQIARLLAERITV